jgi:hypothetical protein
MNAFDAKTIGANLLTVSEFAAEKGTTRVSVSTHISSGKIIPTYVGREKHVFIDAKKYANYTFDTSKINKRYQ